MVGTRHFAISLFDVYICMIYKDYPTLCFYLTSIIPAYVFSRPLLRVFLGHQASIRILASLRPRSLILDSLR